MSRASVIKRSEKPSGAWTAQRTNDRERIRRMDAAKELELKLELDRDTVNICVSHLRSTRRGRNYSESPFLVIRNIPFSFCRIPYSNGVTEESSGKQHCVHPLPRFFPSRSPPARQTAFPTAPSIPNGADLSRYSLSAL